MTLQETKAIFEEKAATYHNLWEQSSPEGDIARNRLLTILATHRVFSKETTVLDVGCGNGTLLPFMEPYGLTRIVELDIAVNMLENAKKRADTLSMARYTEFVQGDGSTTDFAPNQFDTIIVFNAFPHFLDKQNAILEWARITKPGGEICILHSMSRQKLNDMHKKRGFNSTTDCLPNKDDTTKMLQQSGLTLIEYVDEHADYYLLKAKKL